MRLRSSALPTRSHLKSIYSTLKKKRNVVGCFIGRRRAKGRACRELAVVCCVSEKPPARDLAADHRIPKRVRWLKTTRRNAVVRTDVQRCGESALSAAVAGPGDLMMPPKSTLGFAIRHPVHGLVITTAGHSFIKDRFGDETFVPPRAVVVTAATGVARACRVLKAVVQREADYALIKVDGDCANLFEDEFVLDGIHWARPEDVDRKLFALTNSGLKETRLRGVDGSVQVGALEMDGLLLTDKVTIAGDSGAALVDENFRLWGLLVGFITSDSRKLSVFYSANWVLALERAEMA